MLSRQVRRLIDPCRLNRHFATTPNTIDDKEFSKFKETGSKWWDGSQQSSIKPLHQMNPTRVNYIRRRICSELGRDAEQDPLPLRDLRVLDIGCGGGLLSENLARLGGNVVSVDPAEKSIEAARTHAQIDARTRTIDYRQGTAEMLVEAGEEFDMVCALEVIEHVSDHDVFLRTCASLVKPGGSLFMSSMSKTPKALLLAIVGAEYVSGLVPPGTHDWDKFPTVDTMSHSLAQHGVSVLDASGMMYNPLTGVWSLHPTDVDVNFILHAVKSTTPSS